MSDAFQDATYDHNGHAITIEWFHDEAMGAPWEENDGHGPVRDDYRRSKRPGEIVLSEAGGRAVYRLYDFAAALKMAREDGWDAAPYHAAFHGETKRQQAVRAVNEDIEYLRDWCEDRWHWCGYAVTIEGTSYHDSLWGIESTSIDEMESEAVGNARSWLDSELANRADAEARDIVTV